MVIRNLFRKCDTGLLIVSQRSTELNTTIMFQRNISIERTNN